MINIVVPITDKNKDKFESLLSRLDGQEDIEVFVGLEQKNSEIARLFEESDNIYLSQFEDGTKIEPMINSMQKFIKGGARIVLRKPISLDELNKFITCKHDLATCTITRSKFKTFIFNFWQAILRLCLGVKEYEGDTSVVYLSEDISAVVSESENLSFATRANRWRGVEQTTIEVKDKPVEKEINKKTITKYSIIAGLSLLLGIIVTTVLCLTIDISVLVGLLIVCLDLICLAITVLTTIITIFNARVGLKKVQEAKEIYVNEE